MAHMATIVAVGRQIVLGNKFKVFKDRSIEIPVGFSEAQFDEFLEEVMKR